MFPSEQEFLNKSTPRRVGPADSVPRLEATMLHLSQAQDSLKVSSLNRSKLLLARDAFLGVAWTVRSAERQGALAVLRCCEHSQRCSPRVESALLVVALLDSRTASARREIFRCSNSFPLTAPKYLE